MKRGFTLIEIIAVFALLAVVGAVSGLMLSSTVQRFNLEKNAAAMNQKTEVALARIAKEITWADPESIALADGGRTLRWQSRHPSRQDEGEQELTWNGLPGSELLLQGKPLLDNVESFTIPDTAAAGYLSIQLRTTIQPTLHQTLIYLRDDI